MYIYSATRIEGDVGLEEIAATPDWARGRTVRGRVTVAGRTSPNRSCSGHEPTPIVTVRRVDRGPAFRPRTLQTEIRAVRGRSKLAKGDPATQPISGNWALPLDGARNRSVLVTEPTKLVGYRSTYSPSRPKKKLRDCGSVRTERVTEAHQSVERKREKRGKRWIA
ncbi:hypothetical protein TIFTF001_025615 [Ficus carica]|uniref:Uncharacterized protein n=1 Tax=Ficus carica TaxID=3494 RepID=A0AA88DFP2_FICCA|nr:hypothetical protein TIFTF001_025615 [Ficus carica]